jgi:hypothetical protein
MGQIFWKTLGSIWGELWQESQAVELGNAPLLLCFSANVKTAFYLEIWQNKIDQLARLL